ncbi:sodium/potassium-transporting ATPase subunit alpha-3-like [Oppia nitens]|uniref:sodium/potassium-transporting ATPase subunit alpha-3-like n=1 Tax=Oppia nitens TaxID=1686743 RepID=UPI0023DB4A06|nr:sodium/potassium-transporting ATPase subunit alpha-3-like [Oppia nitens]
MIKCWTIRVYLMTKVMIEEIDSFILVWKRERRLLKSRQMDEKRKKEVDKVSNHIDIDDHIIPLQELCLRLHTHPQLGLSPVAVKKLLSTNGYNIVTTSIGTGEWIRLLKNLFDWFNCFLWIGSLLCFMTYITETITLEEVLPDDLYLGCSLLGSVLISGCFSYYQEAKSANTFLTFRDLIPRYVTVIRAGSKLRCPAIELVVGDVIEISAGDRVPADIRIIKSHGLKCLNVLLYGNSKPFIRNNECTHSNPFETKNLVFFSTNCIEGSAIGIVIRTGDKTLMSELLVNFYKEKSSTTKSTTSLLKQDITLFIRIITTISIIVAVILSIISSIIGYTWLNAIIFLIALFVAQIPEGLFPTLTVVLSLAAKRMTAKNCLVKNYETIETLGLTSIIITNKTGTLTQNRMVVSHIWANNSIIDSENFYRHLNTKNEDLNSMAWKALIRAACLSNKAEFSAAQTKISPLKREAIGNSTDIAILKYMEVIIGCVEGYRQNHQKVFEMPFNPFVRYSLSINKFNDGFWLCMKGSPEVIFDKCSTILTKGSVQPLDEKYKIYFKNIINEFGCYGERVIAFCDRFLSYDEYPIDYTFDCELQNYPTDNLRFIGLMSLLNPPRASVPSAIDKCKRAGIKIVMTTGDHPITAKAIAKAVGIISDDNSDNNDIIESDCQVSIITGQEMNGLCDQRLHEILNNDKDVVFAQINPNHRSRIVRCCRSKQSVVTVTENNYHDSSTEDNVDISIAMGLNGSDISKQSADIILLDDNFASIVSGIEEGRVIFDNLKKSICYTLSSKTPIIFPFLLYIIIDIPLPLGAITILCIDLITDMIPAISLAYELPEYDIMKYKPRDPTVNKLINKNLLVLSYTHLGVFQLLAAFFAYFVIMSENGFKPQFLFGMRKVWDSKAINDVMDSYGQEWTYHSRKTLEYTCHTAYFVAVVITKWSTIICCKTRRLSIVIQKMNNDVLTFALFFELGLAIFLTYCPGLDKGINMFALKLYWWFCSTPFAIIMIIYDEFRRLLIRRYPNGWLENETYY